MHVRNWTCTGTHGVLLFLKIIGLKLLWTKVDYKLLHLEPPVLSPRGVMSYWSQGERRVRTGATCPGLALLWWAVALGPAVGGDCMASHPSHLCWRRKQGPLVTWDLMSADPSWPLGDGVRGEWGRGGERLGEVVFPQRPSPLTLQPHSRDCV